MKVAISGKGGTGKSTLAAALARIMQSEGWNVLALDSDPDGNLACTLGATPEQLNAIFPISKQKTLIEERTGAKVREYGQMFKLNPEVADIAEAYGTRINGINLVVLGAIEAGGSGCACPENVLTRALVTHLVLHRKDALIMDMEAGVEHLGRATAQGVDTLLVMVDPSQRALDSAHRVARLAAEIGLRDVRYVANKVATAEDEQYLRRGLAGKPIAGIIPWSEEIRRAEKEGQSVLQDASEELVRSFREIFKNLQTGQAVASGV